MRSNRRAFGPALVVLLCVALGGAAAAGLYDLTDDEASGPEQPISFSHRLHATDLGIQCLYCHSSAETSQHAGIPAVSVCMGCHQFVKQGPTPGSEAEIAKLAEAYASGESIPWVRVHNLPEHVQFKHFRHTNAGIRCQECHGPVETMNQVWLVPETKLRSAWLPAAKLEMGWCMDCHVQRGGSEDCAGCHY